MTTLADSCAAAADRVLEDLTALVAIPSISADPARAELVQHSAETVAASIRDLGCPDVRIVSEGGQPAVIARFPAPQGAPTICLYAHHDVQPTGDEALWTTSPFTATVRGERMFGRGVADDKGGFCVHLAALRALLEQGPLPVGVTLFIEGEEEIGSPSLGEIIARHADQLASDAFVIADSGQWDVGVPSFTTTLRGLTDCIVEVRTLDHALHSGQYGGVAPDALTALCRLIATLHDEHGNVAVEGLVTAEAPDLVYPPDRLRAESGVLDGVRYLGEGSVVSRLWTKPAVSVLAIDCTPIAKASNTLAPSARAKLSLRLAPGDDHERALDRLTEHLQSHAPYGAHVTVTRGDGGQPSQLSFAGPIADAARAAYGEAFGVEPVTVGQGGSIPMAAEFADRFPDATILVTAVCDPDSRMHGIDESLHLGDFAKAIHAEAAFLARLGGQGPASARPMNDHCDE